MSKIDKVDHHDNVELKASYLKHLISLIENNNYSGPEIIEPDITRIKLILNDTIRQLSSKNAEILLFAKNSELFSNAPWINNKDKRIDLRFFMENVIRVGFVNIDQYYLLLERKRKISNILKDEED